MLLFLAPELIQEISDQLAIDDIKQLRLTCRDLGNILASIVFRSITIDIRGKTLDDAIPKLRFLARKASAASQGTRKLTIKALAPKSDPKYREPVWNRVGGVWVQDTGPEVPPDVQLAGEEMKKYLYDAIAFLQCVRTVFWTLSGKDDGWTHTRIMDALINISSLENFHIDISFFQADVPFHLFKSLRTISISISSINGSEAEHFEKTFDNLAKMIARSPQLESILIDCAALKDNDKIPNCRQLFKYYPKGLPPLRLRFLSMMGCPAHFDNITMPHLQHLRSLNCTGTNKGHSRIYFDIVNAVSQLWTNLRHSKILLEEITVDIILPQFIDYIGSFSGVRKLIIETGGFTTRDPTIASSFYLALQHHVQSLEKLHFAACRGRSWCFGAHNSTLISQCLKLEYLHMRIAPQDMVRSPPLNVIELLIDTVTTSNPKLDSLQLSLACNRHEQRQMHIFVERYRAPVFCTRLPSLRIDFDGALVSFLGDFVNGTLVYRAISGRDPFNR